MTKQERLRLASDTEELRYAVLPMPREIKSVFKKYVEKSFGCGYEYVEYLAEVNGRLLQRIFCYQLHGLRGTTANSVMEIGRRYEGGHLVVTNLVKDGLLSPLKADDVYIPEDVHESGWSPKYAVVLPKKNHKLLMEYPAFCVNEKKWMKKYPYCAWDIYKKAYFQPSFFKYLCYYRANPKVELLVKAGYSNFVSCCNMLDTNAKSLKGIFKLKQNFDLELLKYASSKDLQILRANEWIDTKEKLSAYATVKERERGNAKLKPEEIKYLTLYTEGKNVYNSYWEYTDYLRMADKLGYPMNENKFHYPKDLKKAHDKASDDLLIVKSAKHEKSIKSLSRACQGFTYEKDGYVISPVTCAEELINESRVLEHCVRTYIDDVAEHKSLILFVRKAGDKDTPFVTLELVKGRKSGSLMHQFNKITQVYGFKDSEPDQDTIKFVMGWKKEFNLKGWSRQIAQ